MPLNKTEEILYSDDIQDVMTAAPSWLLKCGITIFFIALALMVTLSAYIRYPEIVNASIKIQSSDSPKPVVTKLSGKLRKLLVQDHERVIAGQALAYMESTADHIIVLSLLAELKQIQKTVGKRNVYFLDSIQPDALSRLGELQVPFQVFFQSYLDYKSTSNNGLFLRKRILLKGDLDKLTQQEKQFRLRKEIELEDYKLAGKDFEMHQSLKTENVETNAEFRNAQSKYLSKKSPLIQTEADLIASKQTYSEKQKEILELDNQISEAKGRFLQALNSLVSQAEDWKSRYVLSATDDGTVSFADVVQENENLSANQEVFYINPGTNNFFGIMSIPQENMGKVKEGEEVLIKLKSYPFEQYGMIRGKISKIADVPLRDSIFLSEVKFNLKHELNGRKEIQLKQGMSASAEIITQNATILQRLSWNMLRLGSGE